MLGPTQKQNGKARIATQKIRNIRKKQETISKIKAVLIWFFYQQGVVHKEYVSKGQILNQV